MAFIPEKGMKKEEIFAILQKLKENDIKWQEGKVFAYIFSAGAEADDILKKAYMMYLSENALDPTSFPSVLQLERDVVRFVADLLRGGPQAVGNFTSGGTESNFLAVKSARDKARLEKPHITKPEIVIPRSGHGSFHKAASLLGVKPVTSEVNPKTFQADVESMRKCINENTILLVASAPSYPQGVIDPIKEISELAIEHNLLFHVDGCMGGIMLSFLREMEEFNIPDFDFTVPGVTSISADLHKFGYAAKGASTIIYRNKEIRRHQLFANLSSMSYALINSTFLSSKTGGPMASAWALIHFLGKEGYRKIYKDVMVATKKLIQGINATGDLYVLGKPDMCIFSFTSDKINIYQVADEMKKRGWYIQPQFSTEKTPPNLHLTVTYINIPMVDEFLKDLNESLEVIKKTPNKIDMAVIRKQVKSLIEGLGENAIEYLKKMAGIQDTNTLPEEMALISSILDSLPTEIAEALLIEYFNDLFV